ncbi:MAG: hypothetical protein GC180_01460 [Bacteroidetes bacterium]|nr:hypothetical protein [Bacteroidota bacterium]
MNTKFLSVILLALFIGCHVQKIDLANIESKKTYDCSVDNSPCCIEGIELGNLPIIIQFKNVILNHQEKKNELIISGWIDKEMGCTVICLGNRIDGKICPDTTLAVIESIQDSVEGSSSGMTYFQVKAFIQKESIIYFKSAGYEPRVYELSKLIF